jgi:hypothetical protein
MTSSWGYIASSFKGRVIEALVRLDRPAIVAALDMVIPALVAAREQLAREDGPSTREIVKRAVDVIADMLEQP